MREKPKRTYDELIKLQSITQKGDFDLRVQNDDEMIWTSVKGRYIKIQKFIEFKGKWTFPMIYRERKK